MEKQELDALLAELSAQLRELGIPLGKHIACLLYTSKKPLSELAAPLKIYPQVLENVPSPTRPLPRRTRTSRPVSYTHLDVYKRQA